ncbi:MAG: amidase [Rhodospirillaceae bacterium]
MDAPAKTPYDPRTFRALTYCDLADDFRSGKDSPRDFVERCLETVKEREPAVKAFASLNEDAVRQAADESSARWKAGKPWSPLDGMPVSIKDLLETKDHPTQLGCEAFRGNFPKRDNAAVCALRQAGAVIFGKTVTAELGGTHPGPTTNPFDPARTPGGSSSGSAAAVAARMTPAAIGSQVGGSIIRPAAYCGNFALKPSQGGLNRGERMATSLSTHGPHAGSLRDMWQVAIEIAKRAGGDRGSNALKGPDAAPTEQKPARLMVLETAGWARTDEVSKAAFGEILGQLKSAGVELADRKSDKAVDGLEAAIAEADRIATEITLWENRWSWRNWSNEHPGKICARIMKGVEKAETMTPADYEGLLAERLTAIDVHKGAQGLADAAITLSCPGPAPLWDPTAPGADEARRPTGDAIFNYPSSMLGAPVVTLPMIGVGGLPVGVQIMGQPGEDAKVTALARWVYENLEAVCAG